MWSFFVSTVSTCPMRNKCILLCIYFPFCQLYWYEKLTELLHLFMYPFSFALTASTIKEWNTASFYVSIFFCINCIDIHSIQNTFLLIIFLIFNWFLIWLTFWKAEQGRIQDNPPEGDADVQICQIISKRNCMKLKKFWYAGGSCAGGSPLDSPVQSLSSFQLC